MKFDLNTSGGLGLTAAGLPLLRDLVHERTGLFYDDSRCDMLADRVSPLVIERGFSSFLDFYYLLKYDVAGNQEWPRVLDALGVQETYFWREVDQIRAIACHVVPAIAALQRGLPVKIWSLPCSSGEEPLTIAMVLEQAGSYARAPIEIHAADGSPAAIERARDGRYRARSFRAIPADVADRYFEVRGEDRVPVPPLRQRITSWNVVNLMAVDTIAPLLQDCHIVFCRNAFIYFSPQSVGRVVSMLADVMPPPAYLCVGASESLLNVTDRFALEDVAGAFMYVKR